MAAKKKYKKLTNMEIKKFEEGIKAKGETTYNIGELYKEVVAPVMEL